MRFEFVVIKLWQPSFICDSVLDMHRMQGCISKWDSTAGLFRSKGSLLVGEF